MLRPDGPASTLRSVTGHAAALSPGPWRPGEELPDGVLPLGFMVTQGLLSRELLLGSGVASDLLGPGDLVGLGADSGSFLPTTTRWVVCSPSQVTYLDEALMERLRERPEVASRLLSRAAMQSTRQATHRAISQLPRVELRLLAFLWLLAERWGRVGTHGIVVPMALTHEALGRMVGARRPTVSLALKQLDEEGAVHRRGDGSWVLSTDSTARLDGGRPPSVAPPPEELASGLPALLGPDPLVAATHACHRPVRAEELAARVQRLTDEHAHNLERMQQALEHAAVTRALIKQARERRERRRG
jgi:CRP/FNR family transcriptional regulator, cyclic AMP receptor protein